MVGMVMVMVWRGWWGVVGGVGGEERMVGGVGG
jgi:hypothetical protein